MSRFHYEKIREEIESLPIGNITNKKIYGKIYPYYQWREGGKQRAKRVKGEELERLKGLIARRKELENLIKEEAPTYYIRKEEDSFSSIIRTGKELEDFVRPVKKWKKRSCYLGLRDYVYGEIYDRVYILYGLRRTGKTTLIRQLISEMPPSMRGKSAFIQVQESLTLSDLNRDLRHLEKKGYRYVFIDEVTLLGDFLEGAALFSDVFAASGMKIVLSGTDSLGFLFSKEEELYDRCIMTHTTFIPYNEFESVLGMKGIDNYIRYGGTMSLSGENYNKGIFASKRRADEYVDSAIAKNIQHSLKNYQGGGHFRSLADLYEKNELTNVINRIVEDMNHRFTLDVITRDFKSNDLRISANNLRKDREKPSDILDRVDLNEVNTRLKVLLEIKDKKEWVCQIEAAHRIEIKEYLDLLDLTVDIETRWMSDFNKKEMRTVFSQPGMRYAQAEALILSLMEENSFRDLSLTERNRVTERILSEIKGRMMEDLVLLETKLSKKNAEVFKLQFAIGEFDMVIFYPKEEACEIFEIKYSKEVLPEQARHLLDGKKCKETEFRYGKIKGRYVIYRGKDTSIIDEGYEGIEDVKYLNVEEYLKGLGENYLARRFTF